MQASAASFRQGSRVYVCLRPERITLVRKEREVDDLPNVLEGEFVGEESDGSNVVLQLCLRGPRLAPDWPCDLENDVPVYVYERMNLGADRRWKISMKPRVMHLISADD